MEIRLLRSFVEVVRTGGFSRAAKNLYSTQSTISKAVRQLEEEVGLPLLHRDARSVRLTDAGEVVYQRALSLMAETEDLAIQLDELRGLKRGHLRLGLPAIGGSQLFAESFATYRRLYPHIKIELFEHGSKKLQEMVLSGEVDLTASLLPVGEEFRWVPVSRQPVEALIASHHPLAQQETVRLSALKQIPFILFGSGFAFDSMIEAACKNTGFVPEVTARSSQVDFILKLVAAGLGVGFLPEQLAEERAHAGVTRIPIVKPHLYWQMALICRRGSYLSEAAKAWKQLIVGSATDR